MKAQDVLKTTLQNTQFVIQTFLGDLNDADFFVRPGADCNHIAWQLGHLLASGNELLKSVAPDLTPALPEGFAEKHTKETAKVDDPSQFYTKAEYFEFMKQLDDAIVKAIDRTSDSDLDLPSPEQWRSWFPTVGSLYILLVTHSLMHAGQWVPVRRLTGKPVVM